MDNLKDKLRDNNTILCCLANKISKIQINNQMQWQHHNFTIFVVDKLHYD